MPFSVPGEGSWPRGLALLGNSSESTEGGEAADLVGGDEIDESELDFAATTVLSTRRTRRRARRAASRRGLPSRVARAPMRAVTRAAQDCTAPPQRTIPLIFFSTEDSDGAAA